MTFVSIPSITGRLLTAGCGEATMPCSPGLASRQWAPSPPGSSGKGVALRIFVDETVPLAKRERVREATAAQLLPILRDHPQFLNLAVLVSSAPRRGGWQVTVVALDANLSPTAAEMTVDVAVLEGLQMALARL